MDSATCTWNSTKDKAYNTAAIAQDTADPTLKSTKEQTDSVTGATSTRSKGGDTAARGVRVLFGQDVKWHQSNC
jgi:hypothetical protein